MPPRSGAAALGATAHHLRVIAFIVALIWDDWRHKPQWPE